MEIPFTTVGYFIAVIFVSVHCIVVLLLTLGREHTGEKYICCYVEEYDQLVFIFHIHISNANTFGCVWTNIDGPRYLDFTNVESKVVLSKSLYEDVLCLGLRDGDGGNGTVTKQTTRAATVANVTMTQTPTSISCVL